MPNLKKDCHAACRMPHAACRMHHGTAVTWEDLLSMRHVTRLMNHCPHALGGHILQWRSGQICPAWGRLRAFKKHARSQMARCSCDADSSTSTARHHSRLRSECRFKSWLTHVLLGRAPAKHADRCKRRASVAQRRRHLKACGHV